MRLLVCGGRNFDDWPLLDRSIRALIAMRSWPEAIISGMARGADEMAADWAKRNAITVLSFPADWEKHGKKAGPIRNQQMLDEGKPDIVLAMPGGRGTADMVARAKKAKVPVFDVGALSYA